MPQQRCNYRKGAKGYECDHSRVGLGMFAHLYFVNQRGYLVLTNHCEKIPMTIEGLVVARHSMCDRKSSKIGVLT